ncbi:MAG TPA: 50S ribosomal protein L17 [Ruminococcaceae bacterium]|nr:50S ribosomal protein L17 [Oscillospiraceae bacterium]
MPGTRKLGRPTDHRRAMLRGLVTYLFENGKVETTVTRAKEVRAMAEKMITIAKTNTLHSRRQVLAYVTKEDVVKKLFDEIAPKYQDVNGGYTRIIKTGTRRGDAAEMAIIELVEPKAAEEKPVKKTASRAAKKTASTKKAAPKAEEKVEEVKEEAAAVVEEAAEEAPAAVEEAAEEVADAAEEAVEAAAEATEEAAE